MKEEKEEQHIAFVFHGAVMEVARTPQNESGAAKLLPRNHPQRSAASL